MRVLSILLLLLVQETPPTTSQKAVVEVFWASAKVEKKRDEYLSVVDSAFPNRKPVRRIRCTEKLPVSVEKLLEAAPTLKAQVYLQIEGHVQISKVLGTEEIPKLRILAIVVLPEKSPLDVLNAKGWPGAKSESLDFTPDQEPPFSVP